MDVLREDHLDSVSEYINWVRLIHQPRTDKISRRCLTRPYNETKVTLSICGFAGSTAVQTRQEEKSATDDFMRA